MRIGTLQVTLVLAKGGSLKDKRHVVKRVIEALRRRFNVSVAEVDDLDLWRRATLGMAVVSNDGAHCNRMLDKVVDYLEAQPEFEVGAVELSVE
jgi:uncharacterized protein YlxP (DUF503 family)